MKRQNDIEIGESRRMMMDQYINDLAVVKGSSLRIEPVRGKSMSRRLHRQGNDFEFIEYRFAPGAFYLKLGTGETARDGFQRFAERYFLPIRLDWDQTRPVGFSDPIRVGDVPDLAGRDWDRCFVMSEAEGNENRLDCVALNMRRISFRNPVASYDSRMVSGPTVALLDSLAFLIPEESS